MLLVVEGLGLESGLGKYGSGFSVLGFQSQGIRAFQVGSYRNRSLIEGLYTL